MQRVLYSGDLISFILNEMPTEAVIGLGNIARLDLYPIMKEIHSAEVARQSLTTREDDVSISEIELAGLVAEIEKEWEGIKTGLGGYAAVSS